MWVWKLVFLHLEVCVHYRFWPPRNFAFLKANVSLKELSHRSCILKRLAKLFKNVISNPFQSSPPSAILVPFCFRITPSVFFFISKSSVLGFPTLKPWLTPWKKWPKISWRSSFNYYTETTKTLTHSKVLQAFWASRVNLHIGWCLL